MHFATGVGPRCEGGRIYNCQYSLHPATLYRNPWVRRCCWQRRRPLEPRCSFSPPPFSPLVGTRRPFPPPPPPSLFTIGARAPEGLLSPPHCPCAHGTLAAGGTRQGAGRTAQGLRGEGGGGWVGKVKAWKTGRLHARLVWTARLE